MSLLDNVLGSSVPGGNLAKPLGIALQVVLIAALVGLTRIDFSKWLSKAR